MPTDWFSGQYIVGKKVKSVFPFGVLLTQFFYFIKANIIVAFSKCWMVCKFFVGGNINACNTGNSILMSTAGPFGYLRLKLLLRLINFFY